MLTFDPTTTSGAALANLFRRYCELRGPNPEGEVSGGDMLQALTVAFEDIGLDVHGDGTQLDVPAGHSAFTVIGLCCDHSDELYVAGVQAGEHAAAVVELQADEDHFSRYAYTLVAESADAAADLARQQIEDESHD